VVWAMFARQGTDRIGEQLIRPLPAATCPCPHHISQPNSVSTFFIFSRPTLSFKINKAFAACPYPKPSFPFQLIRIDSGASGGVFEGTGWGGTGRLDVIH
jgi:hypothetical protein